MMPVPDATTSTYKDADSSCRWLLMQVKRGNHLEALQLLRSSVRGTVSLELQDSDGDGTALIWAAGHGFDELVRVLLVAGADVNARATVNGISALHSASERGHVAIVRRLLQYGADTEARTLLDETACHLAAYRGHADVVRQLMAAGCDWTRRNWRGNDVVDEALSAADNRSTVIDAVTASLDQSQSQTLTDDDFSRRKTSAS